MKKIILVGDSVVARTDQDGATALIPRISEQFPETELVVLAVGGASSKATLENIKNHAFTKDDLVIVSLGLNDAAPWKQIPVEQFKLNYTALLESIGHTNVVLIAPNPVDTQKQTPPGRDNVILHEYVKVIQGLASKYEMRCINLFEIIRSYEDGADLYVEDGVHLSTAGYDLLYDQLKTYLN